VLRTVENGQQFYIQGGHLNCSDPVNAAINYAIQPPNNRHMIIHHRNFVHEGMVEALKIRARANNGEVRLEPWGDIEIYNWDGQTLCPRTDCFGLF
jgi:hypothetical protein